MKSKLYNTKELSTKLKQWIMTNWHLFITPSIAIDILLTPSLRSFIKTHAILYAIVIAILLLAVSIVTALHKNKFYKTKEYVAYLEQKLTLHTQFIRFFSCAWDQHNQPYCLNHKQPVQILQKPLSKSALIGHYHEASLEYLLQLICPQCAYNSTYELSYLYKGKNVYISIETAHKILDQIRNKKQPQLFEINIAHTPELSLDHCTTDIY